MLFSYLVVLLVSGITGIVNFNRISSSNKVLLLLLIGTLFLEVAVHWFAYAESRYILYEGYAIGSAFLYAWVYKLLLGKSYTYLWLVACFIMLVFIGFVFVKPFAPNHFPSEMVTVSSPFLLLMCFFLYYKILHSDIELPLLNRYEFIFNTAFVVYTSVNFMHLALYDYFVQNQVTKFWSQQIHTLTSILFYLSFSVVFIIDRKSKRMV